MKMGSAVVVNVKLVLALALNDPPLPMFPPSLIVTVNRGVPLVALAKTYDTPAPPRNALMLATVPVNVSVDVPDPPTVTPPPDVPLNVPAVTA